MLFQSPCCLQRFVRTFLYLHRTLYIVIQDGRVFLLAFVGSAANNHFRSSIAEHGSG